MNKFLVTMVFTLAAQISLHAQSMSGDVVGVDAAAGTVSVSTKGEAPRVYRTRPSVEILVNGTRGKLADLGMGMSIKVTSGEPGLATRLEATGTSMGASSGKLTKAVLEQKLLETTWTWTETKDTVDTLTFKAGGIARLSSRPRPFKWEAADGNRVEGVTQMGKKFRILFDDAVTQGRVFEAEGQPRQTKLVPK